MGDLTDQCEKTYSTRQAAEIVGVSYRQLDYWVRHGAVTACRPSTGQGSQRGWDLVDMVAAGVVGALSPALPIADIAACAPTVRVAAKLAADGRGVWIYTEGSSLQLTTEFWEVRYALDSRPSTLVVNVHRLAAGIVAAAADRG